MKMKKTLSLLLAAAMAFGTVVGGTAVASAEEDSGKTLHLYLSDTPASMNGHTIETDYNLIRYMTATLYDVVCDPETGSRTYVDSLADGDPEVSEDYSTWTIKMKEGYTFADGTPITAETLEYSIKMLNDPKLANRNANASDFVNGTEYLLGECDWEDVGFKAIDEYTIQITYLPGYEPSSITRFKDNWLFAGYGVVHPEMYESCLNADGTACTYGTSLDTFVASGLYEPTELIEGQYLELTRRTDGGAVMDEWYTPDTVEYTVVTDSNTKVEMFESGQLDYVVANQSTYDGYSGAYYLYTPNNYGIYINSVSPENEILKDVNFRYALYWGLDRDTIVSAVYPTSLPSALQYMPWATMDDPENPGSTVLWYDTEQAKAETIDGHEITQSGYDPDLALEYFEKAYEANGGEKVSIVVKYSDSSDTNKTWAEAVVNAYTQLFGEDRLELTLQATPYATIYDDLARTNMDYEIVLSCGWYQSTTEPWNNTNWVYSGAYTYNTQYCTISTEEYQQQWDELYYSAATGDYKHDDAEKLNICAQLEEILYNDCSFVPAYARGDRYFFSSRISIVSETGDSDYDWWLLQATFNE